MISPAKNPYVPSKGSPLQVSLTEMLHFQSLLWLVSQIPQLRSSPLQVLLTGPLWREMPVSRAFFYISQSPYWTRYPDKNNISPFFKAPSPVKELIIHVPLTGLLWRYAYFQSLSVHISQRPQWRSCSDSYLAADKKHLVMLMIPQRLGLIRWLANGMLPQNQQLKEWNTPLVGFTVQI